MPNRHPVDQYTMSQPPSNPYRTLAKSTDGIQDRAVACVDVGKATLIFHCEHDRIYHRTVTGRQCLKSNDGELTADDIGRLSAGRGFLHAKQLTTNELASTHGFIEVWPDDLETSEMVYLPTHRIIEVVVRIESHTCVFIEQERTRFDKSRTTHGGPG